MGTPFVVGFEHQLACDKSIVGGKGLNLGLLTQAGFDVPNGFTVTTAAYSTFISGLQITIDATLNDLPYDDADQLEQALVPLRASIVLAKLPDQVQEEILDAYHKLGPASEAYVAVRSSGTAEDLAEASFAGLHDTILDVRGKAALFQAIKECFASLFSSRAVAYRHRNGFKDASIALVVQRMIASESAGVLFTANPLSQATDEIVINSSWGLGEAVVSSLVEPDLFILKAGKVRLREKKLGSKQFKIFRDPAASWGTKQTETLPYERERYSLTDDQACQLARLGLRIQSHYGGFPQDIEWGFEAGHFYVLQSRPVTGIEFSWDVDCEDYQIYEHKDDVVWTRTQADESWSGAVTPLFYSCRASSWDAGHQRGSLMWDVDKLKHQPYWKFHKATPYYNTEIEKGLVEIMPTQLRGDFLMHVPPVDRDKVMQKPFSWFTYLKLYARVELFLPQLYAAFHRIDVYWRGIFSTEGKGVSRDELKEFSDEELKRYLEYFIQMECEWNISTWTFWFVYCRDMLMLLKYLVTSWFDANDHAAYQTLLTGSKRPTETMKAQHELWRMSELIRRSPILTTLFKETPNAAFFQACKESSDGQKLLAIYDEFISRYGQRGMPDRDMSFKRRCEDPAIDYRALASMLASESSIDPSVKEKETNLIREEMASQVMAKIRAESFGFVKVAIFKVVYNWCLEFICTRDDERNYLDNLTLTWRFGFLEVGRRLTERGVFQESDDVWFLCRRELWPILFGAPLTPLLKAKMDARRRDFNRMAAREIEQPTYLKNGAPVDLEIHAEDQQGLFSGSGTAQGKATGRAKVVRQLKDIGKVKEGDILVVNATDPGWTPVFHIIQGIVLETGGILSHGSCLARECGLPAVQLPSALNKIPDGALISIDGTLGTIHLLDETQS